MVLTDVKISECSYRMGEEVNPDPRWVQCNELKVVDFSPPNLIFDLVCGRGFYVRSLVHDLGLSKLKHQFSQLCAPGSCCLSFIAQDLLFILRVHVVYDVILISFTT